MSGRRFLSYIKVSIGFSLMVVSSLLFFAVALLFLPWRNIRIRLGNAYGKFLGRTVLALLGVKPVISNRERLDPKRPAIYVANHASNLDVFGGMWLCPYGGCGVAKREIASIPFFGWLYRLVGHLLIDRGDRDRAIASLAELAGLVEQMKLSVWIWPEGTRSPTGHLRGFKKGFGHIALATGLPVVPVVFRGAHRLWGKGSWEIRPGRLEIRVLEPIDTSSWTEETLDEHVAEVRAAVATALPEDQQPLPDKKPSQAEAPRLEAPTGT